MNCKIIALANQKGGTGKTTTTISLVSELTSLGYKVLAVDFDPQSSLTICQGIYQPDELECTIADLMRLMIAQKGLPENLSEYIRHDKGFDYIASDISLSAVEMQIVTATRREYLLSKILQPLCEHYDYILLDCPPTLGQLFINALTAAHSVLVPVQAEFLSAKGLELLTGTIFMVKNETNPTLEIEGILLTMSDVRTKYTDNINSIITEYFGEFAKIYKTKIPRSIGVTKGQEQAQTVFEFSQCTNVAKAYTQFTQEMLSVSAEVTANE